MFKLSKQYVNSNDDLSDVDKNEKKSQKLNENSIMRCLFFKMSVSEKNASRESIFKSIFLTFFVLFINIFLNKISFFIVHVEETQFDMNIIFKCFMFQFDIFQFVTSKQQIIENFVETFKI